ncbi:two-component system response regulator NarL [Providencia vermicola]|uniref:two-component system response regulator NarL n=1 Tax=Providencia TaxID=586 RepID=UPI00234A7481|nr:MULTISPECIES: two-component system response regulator NarL [Providencia]ELR5142529.1 two-component system response regulator NarL [Providencia stuartii]WER22788.1 two-component system response regulator NarL [Providencia stuartii]WER26908.1 two-component system response regulator NarL [Providencia stuartii]WER30998.1 two-component system response regulator NarL [Providencia stuartii]
MENTNTTSEKSTILLIDDHPMLRNGVKQLISLEPSLCVVGEAGDGATGIKIAEEQDPDLILLDLNMPGMNGFETLDELRKRELSGRIILFTVSNYGEDLVSALKHGADGYLLKDMEPEELIVALKEAASGKMVVSPALTSVLAESLRDNRPQTENNLLSLTPRETNILDLISQGLSNKMIARKLDIAESTVKVHVKHLLKKLNLKSRVEAAVWVLQQK